MYVYRRVCVSGPRDREKDKLKGAEDAEVVEVETMDTAGGIEAGKFWDPYLDPPTPSLQTYLRALPSGQYYGTGKFLVATDGSLRLRRKEKERDDGSGSSVATGRSRAAGQPPRREGDPWVTKGGSILPPCLPSRSPARIQNLYSPLVQPA